MIGLKLDLCSYPTPDVLYDHPRHHDRLGINRDSASIQIGVLVAMYSSK